MHSEIRVRDVSVFQFIANVFLCCATRIRFEATFLTSSAMNATQNKRVKHYEDQFQGVSSGDDAVAIFRAALEDEELYVYGELAGNATLREYLPATEARKLELFARGELSRSIIDEYALSVKEERKLRMMALMSVVEGKSQVGYDTLVEKLLLDNDKDLELIVRDAISLGLIRARMDQHERVVEISACAGRDVDLNNLPSMLTVLNAWLDRTQVLVKSLDERINYVGVETKKAAARTKQVSANAAAIRQRLISGRGHHRVNADIMSSMGKTGFNGSGTIAMDTDDEDELMTSSRRRPPRGKTRFQLYE